MSLMEINWRPEAKQLRTFGLVGLAAFGLLGVMAYFRHRILGFHVAPATGQTAGWVFWALAVLCGGLAVVAPALLRPLYVGLTAVSMPIGFVMSHVIMAVLYYGLFTPVGLLFRLVGRDPLDRKFEPNRNSYWLPREQVTDVKRYFRQF